MKIQKTVAVISSTVILLLTLSFSSTFAFDSPLEEPQQSVAQNTETNQYSEGVALPEQTSPQTAQPNIVEEEQQYIEPEAPLVAIPEPAEEAPPVEPAPKPQVVTETRTHEEPTAEDNTTSQDTENSEENAENIEENTTPEDLPDVESDEIIFPEVIAPSSDNEQKPKNIIAGVIAWTCIVLGISIVLFVLIKGRNKGDIEPKTMKVHNSGHKKKTKRLLDDKYYKNK